MVHNSGLSWLLYALCREHIAIALAGVTACAIIHAVRLLMLSNHAHQKDRLYHH